MFKLNTSMHNLQALEPRHITVGALKRRLGMDAFAIAVSTNPVCIAAKEMLYDQKFANLDDPLIAMLLDSLIAASQPDANPLFPGSGPMTEAKKLAILSEPIVPYEKP